MALFQPAPRGGGESDAGGTTAARPASAGRDGRGAQEPASRDIPPGAPRLEAPDLAALSDIRPSADWLARHHETFTKQLRYEMTLLVPGSAMPGSFDMESFCHRMVRTLLWAARTDQPGHVVADVLRQAGAKNWSEGFPDDEYASVAHALVQTVRYLTPDDWSTSTGSAWVSFFVWARPHLLEGAGSWPG